MPPTDVKAPSLWEPVTDLRRVPIRENDEPLVDFRIHCPDLMIDRARFKYRRETMLRRTVAERLREADLLLRPKGMRIAIVEGWRPPHIQARMYRSTWNRLKEQHPEWSDTHLRRVANRFTAPVNRRVPPPHTTGGAIDILLADAATGEILDHHSPYDSLDHTCFPTAAPSLSEAAQETRAQMAEVMAAVGITNYPSEYWHWSYGDQGWAYRGGEPHALYGITEPAGYIPAPEDVSEEPLEML